LAVRVQCEYLVLTECTIIQAYVMGKVGVHYDDKVSGAKVESVDVCRPVCQESVLLLELFTPYY
jgi:hypothetical protein